MPDTLSFPSPAAAVVADDRALASEVVRHIASGRSLRPALDAPLPPAARPTMEALASVLDEFVSDLTRLRRRRGAPSGAGGRIRLAVAEAELHGAYAQDAAEALAVLRGAGVTVVSGMTGERGTPRMRSASSCICAGRQGTGWPDAAPLPLRDQPSGRLCVGRAASTRRRLSFRMKPTPPSRWRRPSFSS